MNNNEKTVYYNHIGGVIGLPYEDSKCVERFDREFSALVCNGICKEHERWDYINHNLHEEGIIDDHIFITRRR